MNPLVKLAFVSPILSVLSPVFPARVTLEVTHRREKQDQFRPAGGMRVLKFRPLNFPADQKCLLGLNHKWP
jgi:hypothetical protein